MEQTLENVKKPFTVGFIRQRIAKIEENTAFI